MKTRNLITCTLLAGLIAFPVYAKKEHHDLQFPPGGKMNAGADRGNSPLPWLKKKPDNNRGSLPQGWKKKLVKGKVLDRRVYDQGAIVKAIDSNGIITFHVDDKILRLHKATREIMGIVK